MIPEHFNPPAPTREQQFQQHIFFENVRLMRLYYLNWRNDNAASDYRKFKLHQSQVDKHIKEEVRKRKREQPELFE